MLKFYIYIDQETMGVYIKSSQHVKFELIFELKYLVVNWSSKNIQNMPDFIYWYSSLKKLWH